mmetsp:Transcript_27591/g.71095  ORF Transcript_27591/g.71095 Transcript_27591/m.71095 type:complete len:202 (+) Transcript_27591:957-1562(+)
MGGQAGRSCKAGAAAETCGITSWDGTLSNLCALQLCLELRNCGVYFPQLRPQVCLPFALLLHLPPVGLHPVLSTALVLCQYSPQFRRALCRASAKVAAALLVLPLLLLSLREKMPHPGFDLECKYPATFRHASTACLSDSTKWPRSSQHTPTPKRSRIGWAAQAAAWSRQCATHAHNTQRLRSSERMMGLFDAGASVSRSC